MKNIKKNTMKKFEILGIPIDVLTLKQASEKLAVLMNKKNSLICTPNTEFIVLAQKDLEFKNILNKISTLNCADGIGILWAARFLSFSAPEIPVVKEIIIFLQWIFSIILIPFCPNFFKNPIPERISGADFVWTIAKFAAQNNYKIFLLGGAPTIVERTALVLQTQINDLRVAGIHAGSPKDTVEIIETVNKSHADILLVAFGAPKQEKWLVENLSKTTCKIGIGLGGTFDFIAKTKKRAPVWVQHAGLEWLFRLIQEPSRIIRQASIPKFMWLVLVERFNSK